MCYDPPDPNEEIQLKQLADIKKAFENEALKNDPIALLTAINIILNGSQTFTIEQP
jgi:hypothetical protein